MTETLQAPTETPSADAEDLTPEQQLLRLHRQGELIAEYPRLGRLLTELSGHQLVRAGQLLSRLPVEEVLATHPGTATITVALTGHSTIAALVPALTGELARHGIALRAELADFDSYIFELSDPASGTYASKAAITVCVLDPTIVFAELPDPWTIQDVERVLAEKTSLFGQLAASFARNSTGTLVLNTIPLPRNYSAQLIDLRARARLGRIWREANARILALMDDHPGLVVIDLDPLIADGLVVRDPRLSAYTKTQLSPDLLAAFARELGHLARASLGRGRKCLALDLDNTVWGGILGDDGLDGIEVTDSYRGEAFKAFQKLVRQLSSQGVLLAAVSKNDADLVHRALTEHPEMTLTEPDFVRVIANWGPKHNNLTSLAADLNLGIDSIVFADDSPYECGLIRRELPDVRVLQLTDDPAGHLGAVLADGWFDTLAVTDEDRGRTTMYRQELARQDSRQEFDSIEDYLAELKIEVRFAAAEAGQLARISQTTLRTNQFNLTTQRLQTAQVQALSDDPDALVLAIQSRDRFGDNGLVGAVLAHREPSRLVIDNFLLSCRVFSRGIEQSCLAALLRHAADTGATEVLASYVPTAKNGKVLDFYPANGFSVLSETDAAVTFRHDLTSIAEAPAYVSLTTSYEGATP